MAKFNQELEPTVDDAIPYRTPKEVSDGLPQAAKKFPWVKSMLVALAIVGFATTAFLSRETTREFGVNRARPIEKVVPEIDVDGNAADTSFELSDEEATRQP